MQIGLGSLPKLLSLCYGTHTQKDEGLIGMCIVQPVSWASLALLVVTGIGLILYWDWEKKRQLQGAYM